MNQKEINQKAKDLVSLCHESGVPCVFLAGFDDGATIRAADGPMQEILILTAIGLIQWGKGTGNSAKEMAEALVDTVVKIQRDMDNGKWGGSHDQAKKDE